MNTSQSLRKIVGVVALATLFPWVANADAALHGRVSFDAGGTLVKGVEESDWSNASVNTLVLPGDTLWVDNGGTSEIEFSGGSFLRMADGSKAEIVDMPPNATIRGWIGSFYVQRLSRSSGSMIFYTPAATIEIDNDASVRIDIVTEGVTTVSTRWGRATIRTAAGGSVQAQAGRRVFIEAGLLPSEPTPFDRSAEDAFDRWNRERAEFLATGGSSTPTSVPISNDTIGVSDLGRYGEWVYIDKTPYWRPTVVVDYTPYHNGYWNYVGNVGNVWVGNYPFCYVTSHYGYWDYNRTYGWVWGYRPQWSPAWCATVQYGDYFVWSPVNRYNRPVYPTTSAYFNIGGVSFGYFGTSYCHVSSLYNGPSYVYYANNDPFRRYYGTPNININIWNINTGSRRPDVRVPFNDSVTTVRDYTPRRRIRGADTLFTSSRSAGDRARSLENTSGRDTFSRTTRTGGDFSRTDAARIDTGSRTRNVRIDQQAPDYSRATRSNPIVATNSRTRSRSSESGEAVSISNTRDRDGSTRSRAESPRGTETTRSTEPMRTGTDRGTNRGVDRSSEGSVNRGTTRTARTDIDPAFGSTPVRTRSTSPARTRSDAPERTSAPERSADTPATRTRIPESFAPSTTRSTAAPTRTPARTSTPQVTEAPGRVSSPRNSESFVDRTPNTRSSTATSNREMTRDRNESRATVAPPTRTVAPQRAPEAPQVRVPTQERSTPNYRAPVTARPAPETRQIPSQTPQNSGRSYTPAPSRGNDNNTRSFTAPSRNNAPSYSAPRVESNRGGGNTIQSAPRSSGGGNASSVRQPNTGREGGRGR